MFNRSGVPQSRLAFLRSLALFEGVPDGALSRIDHLLTEVSVRPDRVLTEQGGGSFEAFIIAEGWAEVRVDGEVVGQVGPGELIGELGVLEHRARTAMTLLVLNPRELNVLLHEESLAEQLNANLDRHRRGPQPQE